MSDSRISVITPFYKGNRFMGRLFQVIAENTRMLQKEYPRVSVEFIVVNDSPGEKVVLPEGSFPFTVKVVDHETNGGIHKARVTGLSACSGSFIQFLDQDDELTENALLSQYRLLTEGNGSMVLANGFMETEDGSRTLILEREYDLKKVNHLPYYLKSHNIIKSPGQCLIRKDAVPEEWKSRIMKTNGSDDLYLWILLLSKGLRFLVNREALYVHKFTGENLSESEEKMTRSSLEFLDFLKEVPYVKSGDVIAAERSRTAALRCRNGVPGKLFTVLRNPDVFLPRLLWKARTLLSKKIRISGV